MKKKKLTPQDLTGAMKTAIFLLAKGEEYTTIVFNKMNDREITKVATAMAQIDEVPPEVLSAVADDFNVTFEDTDRLIIGGETFLKSIFEKSMSTEKTESIFRIIEDSKRERPFIWSKDINVATLTSYLDTEHPQTIAMVLAHLPADIAAEVLMGISEDKKADIALRIAQLGQIPEEVVRDVDDALRTGLSDMGGKTAQSGGLQVLVDILNNADKATEEVIMDFIEEENEDMAGDIRQMMFVFEDLVSIDDRGMREILKRVESSQLTLALKTASEDMKQKILSNLSARASEMLLEDLEVMGPVKLSEVEDAQQEIVNAAKELEAEGTITLGGKGAGDVLV